DVMPPSIASLPSSKRNRRRLPTARIRMTLRVHPGATDAGAPTPAEMATIHHQTPRLTLARETLAQTRMATIRNNQTARRIAVVAQAVPVAPAAVPRELPATYRHTATTP